MHVEPSVVIRHEIVLCVCGAESGSAAEESGRDGEPGQEAGGGERELKARECIFGESQIIPCNTTSGSQTI